MIRFYKKLKQLNWKYAIGEVSLIFVGITLAVWFNNWNQDRIDTRKKNQYLLELKNDLREDINEFNYLLAANGTRIRRIDLFNELLADNRSNVKINCDSIQKYMASASFINVFTGASSVFEDLENTGNLILIDDTEFRREVIKYYADVDSRKHYEDLNYRFHINTIGPFLKEHWNSGPLFRLGANEKEPDDERYSGDCKRTISKINEFRNDQQLEQELINHINFSGFILEGSNESYESMKKKAEALIFAIEQG